MAEKIISRFPTQIQRVLPSHIKLNYTDLKNDNCITALCLSAEDVTIILRNPVSGKDITLFLGSVQFERSLSGQYKATSNTESAQIDWQAQNMIGINLSGQTNLNDIEIDNLTVQQSPFNGQLSGQIKIKEQLIDIKGKSNGLANFVKQFVQNKFHFLIDMTLKSGEQDIQITTDDSHILFSDFPIVPKKLLFRKTY